MAEGEEYGIMDSSGTFQTTKNPQEVLEIARQKKAAILTFGGMRKEFHTLGAIPQGSWSVRIKDVFGFDLIGFASFTGHMDLKEWARDWNVEYREDLRGKLHALRGLYTKLKELGADLTPGRTARKVVSEWIKLPVLSHVEKSPELIGGRVQIFYHYAEKVYVYDFNSMYPSVMAYTKLPALMMGTGNRFYVQNLKRVREDRVRLQIETLGVIWDMITLKEPPSLESIETLNRLIEEYYFTHIRIKNFHKNIKPPAPFVSTLDGRRAWVAIPGKEYQITGYEVPLLQGHTYEVISAYGTKADYLPFAKNIIETYKKRQECKERGNKVCDGYYKAVLNAIFGTFGIKQKMTKEEKRYVVDKKGLKELLKDAKMVEADEYGNVEVYQYLKGRKKLVVFNMENKNLVIERVNEEDFIPASIPALAAGIPANGRFLLLWLMRFLINKGHKVYYCDTDSVHTSCEPEELKRIIGKDLMQVKFEGFFEKVYYFAPKTYYAIREDGKDILVAKGVRDFEDEIVIYSFGKEPMQVIRRAIDPESIPLTVPRENDFGAILNVEKKKFKETKLYEIYEQIKSQRRILIV